MLRRLPFLIVLWAFTAFFFSACGGDQPSNTVEVPISEAANRNKPVQATFDNVEEFLALVDLSREPVDVVWKEEPPVARHENGYTKRILAVFRLDPTDADSFSTETAKDSEPKPVEIEVAQWFPTELVTQSEVAGTSTLKGTEYSARGIIKEPYIAGRVVRIDETDYFILEMFGK